MTRLNALWTVVAAALLVGSTAQAQLFRAYLAADGSDTSPCTLQAPCRLLPAALNAVADGGEIWMLDSANYNTATVTIGKSVSILAVPGVVGSVIAIGGTPAIGIMASGVTVALRNLVIAPFYAPSPGSVGVWMTGASSLTVEDSVIANLLDGGIVVDGVGSLKVANTTLRGHVNYAIRLVNGATATVSTTHMLNNRGGIAVFGILGPTTTTASVTDCVISGGGGHTGVVAEASVAGAVARLAVTRTVIRDTQYALRSRATNLGRAELSVGGSLVADNDYAWDTFANGGDALLLSLGDNLMSGNGGSFGAKTPLLPQ